MVAAILALPPRFRLWRQPFDLQFSCLFDRLEFRIARDDGRANALRKCGGEAIGIGHSVARLNSSCIDRQWEVDLYQLNGHIHNCVQYFFGLLFAMFPGCLVKHLTQVHDRHPMLVVAMPQQLPDMRCARFISCVRQQREAVMHIARHAERFRGRTRASCLAVRSRNSCSSFSTSSRCSSTICSVHSGSPGSCLIMPADAAIGSAGTFRTLSRPGELASRPRDGQSVNRTSSPGLIPSASRMSLGMTTQPFEDTLALVVRQFSIFVIPLVNKYN